MTRPQEPATGDEVGVDDEWPATFAQVPDWITLHPRLKAQSVREYAFLMAHVPTDGRRRVAFPGQASIARVLQLGRSDKVTPYTRALVDVGAVRIEEIATPKGRAYRYVLRFNPPRGYDGPRSLSDFYGLSTDELEDRWAGFSMATAPVTRSAGGSPQKEGHPSPQKPGDPYPQKQGSKKTNKKQTNLKNKRAVADAEGNSAGGFERAGADEDAGDEIGAADGGCAASGTPGLPRQRHTSPRPRTTKTRPRQESDAFAIVRAAIPAAVAAPGTRLYAGLHRAINDLLNGAPGIPRRSPEQVVARINRRWYGEQADARSVPDYRGCDRCTPSGCDAPRRSEANPEGCDRIRNRSSWLAEAIIAQDCPDPGCEDGQVIGGGPCVACRERRARRRQADQNAAQAAADTAAAWETQDASQSAARAVLNAWTAERDAEEHRLRSVLQQTGVYGELLEHRVERHITGWCRRHPRPSRQAVTS